MLADQLSANLPDFQVRKIVQLPAEWQVRGLCDVSITVASSAKFTYEQ